MNVQNLQVPGTGMNVLQNLEKFRCRVIPGVNTPGIVLYTLQNTTLSVSTCLDCLACVLQTCCACKVHPRPTASLRTAPGNGSARLLHVKGISVFHFGGMLEEQWRLSVRLLPHMPLKTVNER